jgi:tetratricopeptide (TPR) repeat protein
MQTPESLEDTPPPAAAPPPRRWRRRAVAIPLAAAIPAAIATVVLAAFLPTLDNGFVIWDDQLNFLENERYRGLGWSNLRWMFTTILLGHYVPITWLTLGLDYVLWGMDPRGYHLTSLVVHAANAVLAYLVALRLFRHASVQTPRGVTMGAAAAALVFALHPLRVESVAWATERRDVLSGFFFLATILLYVLASERGDHSRRRLLVAAVGCYVLAILSKSIVMSLPAVLVLLDLYPLRRLPPAPRRWREPALRTLWLEKVPFVLLGLAAAGLGYYAQAANKFFTSLTAYPWTARIGLVAYSYWFYLAKSVVPLALSPLYELPAAIHPLRGRFLVSLVGVVAITLAVVLLRRRWPAGLAAWTYYGLVLAPVSGLAHSGHQLAHDRYSYLSTLAFALLAGAGVAAVARWSSTGVVRPLVSRVAVAGVALSLAGLGVLTWQQTHAWRDTDTLWRTAIEAEPTCTICRTNMASMLAKSGLVDFARNHYEEVLELRPDRVKTHRDLAIVLGEMGRMTEANAHFETVLARYPQDAGILNDFGVVLMRQGRYDEALARLEQARRLSPDAPEVGANLGLVLLKLGRPAEALQHATRVVERDPTAAPARYVVVSAYLALHRPDEARRHHEALKRLDARLASHLTPAIDAN